ncbi:ChrR family anti-sigma-E factor [Asticcacaulis sp. AND118]|uniref:ChrR family anti-sigma-E factor n=1 Tax=Asticcacaulis sp. AND118 TaxID=2840468 RepID=UPI001CFFF345|nr:ChrR family anti-sigma-E factor [Asticcacaulis sp. AND118]UDF02703.1 ChrR family anti-sigma-E factor [Asticcacaulis sp. AND118]
MSPITHHIDELILLDYHRGRLNAGQSLLVATHVEMCAHCRASLRLFDAIGASLLEEVAPVEMSADALELALARIERPEAAPAVATPASPAYLRGIDLPHSVRQAAFKKRYWGAPGVWMAHLDAPKDGRGLTYLMHVKGGMQMPVHDHHGLEMTLVLTGSFSDDGGVYRPGDCVSCDEGDHHSPLIAADDCLCLIAATAPIAPRTLLGKLLQPFARI